MEGTNAGWYIANSITGGGNTRAPMRYMIGEAARANKHSSPDWRFCGKCKSLFYELDEGRCHPVGVSMAPSAEQVGQMQAPQAPLPAGLQRRRMGGIVEGQPSSPPPANAGTELFAKHEAQGPYWRTCTHCQRLFYDAEDSKGACPGRPGGHVAQEGGFPFQIVLGVPPGPSQQDGWRFCDKCYGMFFFPSNADALCPAGGNNHALSDNYVLDYQG